MSAPIDVGNRKQLFIDELFIESTDRTSLVVNTPYQDPEPVLLGEHPWEQLGIGGYNTIMKEGDRYRLWYGASMKYGLPQEGASRLCYAESSDGIHWEKPELGQIEFHGSKKNNIVAPALELQSQQGGTIYRDERASAEERYKLWTKFRPTNAEIEAGSTPGLYAMHSADGINWKVYPDQPNPPKQVCDTQNMLFWDDRYQSYVGYTRCRETQHRGEAANNKITGPRYRSIGRITSPDFRNWSETEIVLQADETDLNIPIPFEERPAQVALDFYTSCAQPYPWADQVYLAFPSIYFHWGPDEFPATMETQLAVSRDGIHWHRPGDRKAFLSHGWEGTPAAGMLYANPWLIDNGNELWLYYAARGHRHGEAPSGPKQSCLYRSSIRRDGFLSVDAGYGGGSFTTPLIQFSGNHLELNCDTGAGGWITVELQDASGSPLPGFAASHCEVAHGNAIRKQVTWTNAASLATHQQQPVRLKFTMRSAKLYAFQFTDS